MTNKDKFIDTMINAPVEQVACFIDKNMEQPCKFCVYEKTACGIGDDYYPDCENGIIEWLEKEVD